VYVIIFPPPMGGGRSAALIRSAAVMVRIWGETALTLGSGVGGEGELSEEHCANTRQQASRTVATLSRRSKRPNFSMTDTAGGLVVIGTLCARRMSAVTISSWLVRCGKLDGCCPAYDTCHRGNVRCRVALQLDV